MNGFQSCAMQYMAMEFIPTTTKGNAQRRCPAMSITQ